mmetsp:Transcript_20679/g.49140  ORF Transcript_20679/g.49140 Transcript_20679/m.49140 type:complete len:244 (+) Transcript_20679:78-809(+)
MPRRHAPNAMPTRLSTEEETCLVAALRASSSTGSTKSASQRTSAVRRSTRLAIPPWPCVAKLASRSSNLVSALAIAACTIASSTTSREVGVPFVCLIVLAGTGSRLVLSGWVATASSDASISWISRSIRHALPSVPARSSATSATSPSLLKIDGCGSRLIFHLKRSARPSPVSTASTKPSPCSPTIHSCQRATAVQSETCASAATAGTPWRWTTSPKARLLQTRTSVPSPVSQMWPTAHASRA